MKGQEIRNLLAGKLRKFRQMAGLTAKEVGDRIGKSEKTVSGWEHGRGQPDADTLFRLCEIYEVRSISEFYSEEDVASEASITLDEKELLSVYRSMNDTGRGLLLSTAHTFASDPAMQLSYQSAAAIARKRIEEAEQAQAAGNAKARA